MTKPYDRQIKEIPLNIVGSSIYGRYPKISVEKTTNMIISDDFLVPYAGYKEQINIGDTLVSRGIFNSARWGKMIAVINDAVYAISSNLSYVQIGTLITTFGDVFIAEDNKYEIGICDKSTNYIYNWSTLVFTTLSLDFQPGFIEYQNGRFISPDISSSNNEATWRLSNTSDSTLWPNDAQHVGKIQTKGDFAVACVRPPGRGNLLLVFGNIVTEIWYDVGAALFPYQRSSSANIDYGVANPATIATLENITVWFATNEKAGPSILYTTGGDITQISTDGINFRLAHLSEPNNCYGFFFKQDGHLLYQLTFPGADDNFSLVYDFTTQKFFDLTDELGGCHIAKRVVYYNNKYYFISFFDGNIYELSSLFTTYDYSDGEEFDIPRSRICKSIRLPDQSTFMVNSVSFTTEQGTDPGADISTALTYFPKIDFSISRDGGYTYGSSVEQIMYDLGKRQNRLIWWNAGIANDFTCQFQFWNKWRFVVTNGLVNIQL